MADVFDSITVSGNLQINLPLPVVVDEGGGMVLYWNLNDGAGSSAIDSSGNSNTGTLYGATLPTWVDGRYGKALSFDGVDNYVELANGQSIFGGKNVITVAFWIKPNRTQSGIHYIEYGIGNSTFSLEGSVPGALFYINNIGQGSMSIPVGQWSHIALVMDGTNSYRYQDGNVLGSNPFSSAINNVASVFDIGGRGSTRSIDALFDEVRIYNRALSAGEISQLYSNTILVSEDVVFFISSIPTALSDLVTVTESVTVFILTLFPSVSELVAVNNEVFTSNITTS